MPSNGRKCVWLPTDQHEMVTNYMAKYLEETGLRISTADALIMILDEWDVMCDARERS